MQLFCLLFPFFKITCNKDGITVYNLIKPFVLFRDSFQKLKFFFFLLCFFNRPLFSCDSPGELLSFTLLAFLCVEGYMPLLQLIIGPDYREGLGVVPIVMAAEIMMGVYFNLSFWYKLIDKTIYGAWFSLAGCIVLVAVNLLFIPRYSYWACAWGGFAGYATCMVLSYVVGQRKNPINYPMKEIAVYVLLTLVLFGVMVLASELPDWAQILVNTALIALFVLYIIKKDLPLEGLPVVGKYFK